MKPSPPPPYNTSKHLPPITASESLRQIAGLLIVEHHRALLDALLDARKNGRSTRDVSLVLVIDSPDFPPGSSFWRDLDKSTAEWRKNGLDLDADAIPHGIVAVEVLIVGEQLIMFWDGPGASINPEVRP